LEGDIAEAFFQGVLAQANVGAAEATLEMVTTLESQARQRMLGADKGYDTTTFVTGARRRRDGLAIRAWGF
jgi:hypothetical protein